MKTLLIQTGLVLIYLIVLPKGLHAQFGPKFKGKVKSYTLYDYYITDQTKPGDALVLSLKEMITFNRQGKQVSEIVYDTRVKDSIAFISTNIYDKKGRPIMVKDNKEHIISKTSYSYDRNNNLVETDSISKHNVFKIIHNKEGERDTMFTDFTTDGSRNKVIYHYTNGGKNIEEIWYKADGNINYKLISRYDKFHQIIDQIKVRPDGLRESREAYTYDDNGNELMEIDSNLMSIGGLPRKEIGDKIYSRTFRYDQFDKAGNWVQQSYLVNDQFVLFSKREIEYY